MNSKQRRKFKREFKYVITINAQFGFRYLDYDMKVSDASEWCDKHIKEYRTNIEFNKTDFYFNDSKDATLFSLKWV